MIALPPRMMADLRERCFDFEYYRRALHDRSDKWTRHR